MPLDEVVSREESALDGSPVQKKNILFYLSLMSQKIKNLKENTKKFQFSVRKFYTDC